MLADVCHAFWNGFHATPFVFQRVYLQGTADILHFGRKKQSAVVQNLVFEYMLGISRKLFAVYGQIVPAFKFCIDSQVFQDFQDWFCVTLKIHHLGIFPRSGKRKVQVSQIVVNRAATRKPSHYFDFVFLYVIHVYFGDGVLVFSHDDGIVVAPKHKAIFLEVFENELVRGDIEVGVGGVVFDTEHKNNDKSSMQN
jgi:hypothetical protein